MARRFMAETLIRPAAQRDLPALVEIFNHYVIHGHVTSIRRCIPSNLGNPGSRVMAKAVTNCWSH
jgi:hypothetical protein